MNRGPLLALLLAGCATLPPPTHVHSVGLGTSQTAAELGADLALSPMMGGSVGVSAPIPGAEAFVPEARVQGNLGSVGFVPGIWLRSGSGEEGLHGGMRIGGGIGIGEAFGEAPLKGQWAGPSLHLQLASNGPHIRGGGTLGAEYLFAWPESLGINDEGEDIAFLDGIWFSLDGRLEVGGPDAPLRGVLGVGVNTWLGFVIVPQATLGLRARL